MLVRCSALPKLMTSPKKGVIGLSETAKEIIQDQVRSEYYGVRKEIYTKPMQKGIECEQQSIDLLNLVFFADYVKNTEKRSNEWISGECDIYDKQSSLIRDIKTSWSMYTFPLFDDKCDYEWQMRGYMMLWDCDTASVDFCLVDTPEHLIGYEQRDIHIVNHIDPFKRVKSFVFERDLDKEQQIIERCEQAVEHYQQLRQKLCLLN